MENKKKIKIIISLIEILIGLIFLILAIYDFFVLPTTTEFDELYGGLVDLIKYKESTYREIFLWSIVLFTGISFWINEKLFWVFNQIVLILFFSLCLFISFLVLNNHNIYFLLILLISSSIFILIERKLYNKKYLSEIGITIKLKIISILSGLICSIIYFMLIYYI